MTIKNNTQETRPTKAVFIHGPQGCGKTVNAAALCKHYGKYIALDYVPRTTLDRYSDNAIVFSNDPLPGSIQFDDAMRAAGLTCRLKFPASPAE